MKVTDAAVRWKQVYTDDAVLIVCIVLYVHITRKILMERDRTVRSRQQKSKRDEGTSGENNGKRADRQES